MRPRRAMTLVEVLAATVLLAMVAATCVPLMRTSMRSLREPETRVAIMDLSDLADAFVVDASAFGVHLDDTALGVELPWSDDPDRAPVVVTRLVADERLDAGHGIDEMGQIEERPGQESTLEHVWLAFRCGPLTVCRCLPLDPIAAERGGANEGDPRAAAPGAVREHVEGDAP